MEESTQVSINTDENNAEIRPLINQETNLPRTRNTYFNLPFWSHRNKKIFYCARWITYFMDSIEGMLSAQPLSTGLAKWITSLRFNIASYSLPFIISVLLSCISAYYSQQTTEENLENENFDREEFRKNKKAIKADLFFLTMRMVTGLLLIIIIHNVFPNENKEDEDKAQKWKSFLEESEVTFDFFYTFISHLIIRANACAETEENYFHRQTSSP